jgi:hypothetical protein
MEKRRGKLKGSVGLLHNTNNEPTRRKCTLRVSRDVATCTPLRTCGPEKWQKIEGIKEVDINQVVTEFAAKKNRRLSLCLQLTPKFTLSSIKCSSCPLCCLNFALRN